VDPIDNTPFLETVMNVLDLGDTLLTRLDEIPDKSPAQEQTYEAVATVISVQAEIIRKLTLHQTELTDKLDDILRNLK